MLDLLFFSLWRPLTKKTSTALIKKHQQHTHTPGNNIEISPNKLQPFCFCKQHDSTISRSGTNKHITPPSDKMPPASMRITLEARGPDSLSTKRTPYAAGSCDVFFPKDNQRIFPKQTTVNQKKNAQLLEKR